MTPCVQSAEGGRQYLIDWPETIYWKSLSFCLIAYWTHFGHHSLHLTHDHIYWFHSRSTDQEGNMVSEDISWLAASCICWTQFLIQGYLPVEWVINQTLSSYLHKAEVFACSRGEEVMTGCVGMENHISCPINPLTVLGQNKIDRGRGNQFAVLHESNVIGMAPWLDSYPRGYADCSPPVLILQTRGVGNW